MSGALGDNLYAIRGLLFSNVSDIKMPLTKPIKFSEDQKRQIHSMLKPGDIILTYTAGYMSNVFLPGSFKHGITYIGTSAERKETGLIDDPTQLIAGINIDKLEKDFSTDTTGIKIRLYLVGIKQVCLQAGHGSSIESDIDSLRRMSDCADCYPVDTALGNG